ncbi:hypothetical protein D9Q98_002337 [Chlorella vulgaris]|uniref:Uncharacterized protein n=1 Tax=Chlorella vulgaris TaxID=3077 RepID=A0A9D4TW22_CHLVU|nr:hypothetical protein D9Q98_002337 [Chlorella vulgaris]
MLGLLSKLLSPLQQKLYSRLKDDSSPLDLLEAAQASAEQDVERKALLLKEAEARCEEARAALRLKREATTAALASKIVRVRDDEEEDLTEDAGREGGLTATQDAKDSELVQYKLSYSRHMKKVAAHKAYVKAVCQRLAVVNACRQAEKAAAQQLHAAQQQRAAAQQAKAESDAALVRVKEQVFVARSTQPVSHERKIQ